MPENTVSIADFTDGRNRATVTSGGALATSATQGTAAANSAAWPMKITNGTATVDLAPAAVSATLGNALLTCQGVLQASTSLNAVTANGNGTAIDFGACRLNFSFVVTTTGSPTGGTVTLSVSLDGTSFFTTATTATVGSGVTSGTLSNVAFRYARLDLTGLTGGTAPTVTAKVMAS